MSLLPAYCDLHKHQKGRRHMKIKTKLILMEMISLFILTALLIVCSIRITVREMNSRVRETLEVAVTGYNGYVGYLEGEGITLVAYDGDTVVSSSTPEMFGEKASDVVVQKVIENGETYFSDDVVINGQVYYGLYQMTDRGMVLAGEPKEGVDQFIKETVVTLVIVGVIAYVLCLIIAILISNSIASRIRKTSKRVETLARGDLSAPVEEVSKKKSRNEIEIINSAVSDLHRQLKIIVSVIAKQTEQLNSSNLKFSKRFIHIADSVSSVDNAMEEIAQGSISQAQETSSASEQVTEMADVIVRNVDNTKKLEEAVSSMTGLSRRVDEILRELAAINQQTSSDIGQVADQTRATNVSAESIEEAVEMIQNIAEQTSLLSLNASIEAARAGEAGKGFAVVAEEIRQLAEESAESAGEIEEIVKELLNNSSVSVATMKKVNQAVVSQKVKLEDTREAFQGLQKGMGDVASVSDSIYEQTGLLEKQKDIIHGVVEQLAAISEQNAASTQQTSASMQSLSSAVSECHKETERLSELSEDLSRQTKRFTL